MTVSCAVRGSSEVRIEKCQLNLATPVALATAVGIFGAEGRGRSQLRAGRGPSGEEEGEAMRSSSVHQGRLRLRKPVLRLPCVLVWSGRVQISQQKRES